MRIPIRLIAAALLVLTAAALVSCGSSGKGLIPSADAGPLQGDFEAVAHAAETGEGSCSQTESALGKTEQDFLKLPATVDRGLHARLQLGVENLRKVALAMCEQPAETKTTGTQTPTTSIPTTSTRTETTPPPQTTPTTTTGTTTTPTTTTPPSESGGTEAHEAEEDKGNGKGGGEGKGEGKGKGDGESNAGAGVGGASPGGGQ